MIQEKSIGDTLFDIVNGVIMLFLVFVTLYPMYYVIVASVTSTIYLVDRKSTRLNSSH
jgi:ABC-type glycerol-3-phosphate transport system permease component